MSKPCSCRVPDKAGSQVWLRSSALPHPSSRSVDFSYIPRSSQLTFTSLGSLERARGKTWFTADNTQSQSLILLHTQGEGTWPLRFRFRVVALDWCTTESGCGDRVTFWHGQPALWSLGLVFGWKTNFNATRALQLEALVVVCLAVCCAQPGTQAPASSDLQREMECPQWLNHCQQVTFTPYPLVSLFSIFKVKLNLLCTQAWAIFI